MSGSTFLAAFNDASAHLYGFLRGTPLDWYLLAVLLVGVGLASRIAKSLIPHISKVGK